MAHRADRARARGNRCRFASGTRFAAKWTPRRRYFARTMADKALLRFSLAITPMRAEDTVDQQPDTSGTRDLPFC
eukprot:5151926-Prymnesium_polylepis.1